MPTDQKTCQNCKSQFKIESDDFAFYEKLAVPAPTFCPECRRQRRGTWRNERTLYRRKCDLCEQSLIGLYPEGTQFPVYCAGCYFSDKWDALSFGKVYDFSKPFFEQFKELLAVVPRLAIWVKQGTNSEYTNQSYYNKDVYLSFAIRDSEDTAYAARAVADKQCLDVAYTHHSEFLYDCLDTDKSYRSRFLEEAEGCVESAFLNHSRNCQNCIGGINLRSASNVFFGEKLSKEEFEKRTAELNLGSRTVQNELLERFTALKLRSPHRFAQLTNVHNVKGDHLSNAKNCHYVFDGFELENARYSSWVFSSKEVSDCYGMGGCEFVHEGVGVEGNNNIKFCSVTDASSHAEYMDLCSSSSNCFGSIALRQKQYCILNRQYTKEEYEALLPKIKGHMTEQPYVDQKGRKYGYGEFFPAELSPFAYNETIAQENFPLSKSEAVAEGYAWREPQEKNYGITMSTDAVPDTIQEISDDITKETIACGHAGTCNDQCSTAFRIVPRELALYRQMNIPLPTLCPNCRFYARLRRRNPLKIFTRPCQCAGANSEKDIYSNTGQHSHGAAHCLSTFETSYSPERPEIIYCEHCYQAEVS